MSRHFTIDGGGGGGAVVFGGARGVPTAPSGTEERTDGRTESVSAPPNERQKRRSSGKRASSLGCPSVRPSVNSVRCQSRFLFMASEREREREREMEKKAARLSELSLIGGGGADVSGIATQAADTGRRRVS